MQIINIFLETRNNTLTDSSQKVVNYFSSIQANFGEAIIHIHHFIPFDSITDSIQIQGTTQYNFIQFNENNLFADESELLQFLGTIQHGQDSKYLFPKSNKLENVATLLATKFEIPLLSNIKEVLEPNRFLKEIFSGKATAEFVCDKFSWLIIFAKSLKVQATQIEKNDALETSNSVLGEPHSYQLEKLSKLTNSIPLPEAQIVVGAGRGLKDPSNWGIIEELANKLGAATACSKPVSDLDWRPHHEHVGQTGVKISPKLYIACGISGAIQHLAGVNNSGKIVVINNDPEAAFFKNADYGIVGDVFEILPRLLKKLN
jgi:electron transfer flavoprotein alpha subunit